MAGEKKKYYKWIVNFEKDSSLKNQMFQQAIFQSECFSKYEASHIDFHSNHTVPICPTNINGTTSL